jgi:hypothetical protein
MFFREIAFPYTKTHTNHLNTLYGGIWNVLLLYEVVFVVTTGL